MALPQRGFSRGPLIVVPCPLAAVAALGGFPRAFQAHGPSLGDSTGIGGPRILGSLAGAFIATIARARAPTLLVSGRLEIAVLALQPLDVGLEGRNGHAAGRGLLGTTQRSVANGRSEGPVLAPRGFIPDQVGKGGLVVLDPQMERREHLLI